MEESLRNLVLVFVISGAILIVFQKLRLPSVVGLLIAGVLMGPHGLGVVEDQAFIDSMAKMGILLLMFSIGLDFTPDRVRELVGAAGLGVWQMLICTVVMMLASIFFVDHWGEAVFLGLMISHTSSTLMIKIFLDRGELSTPQVRVGLGISITQDLSTVPMLLALPILAGKGGAGFGDLGRMVLNVAGVLVAGFVLARWGIPFWMHKVMRSRSREIFLMFLVVVSLGAAWATTALGLSGELGAFLAGLAIAASAYSHQTRAEVVPFRDLLVSLFFISVGMLVNTDVLLRYSWLAALIVAGILVLKFLSGFLPTLVRGYPLRVSVVVGLAMAQIGEFAFVLAHGGLNEGLLTDQRFQLYVLVAILSMLVNPLLVSQGSRATALFSRAGWLQRFERRSLSQSDSVEAPQENHVIVAGLGLNGQTVVRALKTLGIPHIVLDTNPDTVRAWQEAGEPVVFGDCTRVDVLEKAHLSTARCFVVAISDPKATRQAVQVARHENPGLHIIVRTKYMSELETVRNLGASEVIAEEFETSLEILARVLHAFQLPRLRIEEIVEHFRGESYQAFRGPVTHPNPDLLGKVLPALKIEATTIQPGAPAIGKSLRDLDLRARTGATLLAVQRNSQMSTIPSPDYRLAEGDFVVLAGTSRQILDAVSLLEKHEKPADETDAPIGGEPDDSRGAVGASEGETSS